MALELVRRWKAWVHASDTMFAHWLRAAHEALLGEMPVLAAGTALFALISTVPLLAAAVALYSLIADPSQIQDHLSGLSRVLPASMMSFLHDQLQIQAHRSTGTVGLALGFSVVVAVWSSRGAARALVDSLNRAYRVRELRRPAQRFALTLLMATSTMIGLLLLFALVVALPGIFALTGLEGYAFAEWLRWPTLMALLFLALLALYRYAPSPRPLGTNRHLWPGALVGTAMVLVVSIGLSQWVTRVAAYDIIYGTFGSVVIVLLWFYFSTMALVVGGFVNAELERHAGAPAPDRSMY
ncbi:MAG TPA: YihY/virulence factor BrkB family protein [Kofleriaceae bacterium]|nr:YihY/virulence factor BrkB family protein [Kofleriaceae bacterium]